MRITGILNARHFYPLSLAIFISILYSSCAPKLQDPVVARIGLQPLTLSEYERQYAKSLGSREAGAATSQEDREKFLDLVVQYRLKLACAHKDGIDTKPEVISEIAAYKGNLASSYLTEHAVIEPGIKRLYMRQNEEIRASHILISLSPRPSASDSVRAFKEADSIIAALKSGIDFGTLALEHSQDPSVKLNKGDLYYFTAGQLVSPFEDAAFSMKTGEISSAPVRTQYGLHIIKIVDKKPSPGEIRASHIMIRFASPNPSPADTLQALVKIEALRDSLAAGADFAGLAARHSEDPGSASRGGDLGYFARRRWVQPFDEVAMTLKPGQVSNIVRTPYGYHLIKCFDIRPRKSFDESKQDLRNLYQQLRFEQDFAKYYDSVKSEVRFSRVDTTLNHFYASLDTNRTVRDSAWWSTVSPAVGKMPLFFIQGQRISVDSTLSLLKARSDLNGISLRPTIFSTAIDKVTEQVVFAAKADLLAQSDPEFATLLAEYRDGILLYQVEQENVWNKIVMADSALRPYFLENRAHFTWPDRVNITDIRTSSDSLAHVVHDYLLAGKSIEQVAMEDSLRMASPKSRNVSFSPSSARLSPAVAKTLKLIAIEAKNDAHIHLTLSAKVDTSSGHKGATKLADSRLDVIRLRLTKELAVRPAQISSLTSPIAKAVRPSSPPNGLNEVEISIVGRSPIVVGKPETELLATTADERTVRADSLSPGTYSLPFLFKGYYTIVRLNAREKAHEKTYDEAGPELSSSYQDYESKRLETDWLGRLRSDFPVVEYKPVLHDAFLPSH